MKTSMGKGESEQAGTPGETTVLDCLNVNVSVLGFSRRTVECVIYHY